MRRKLTRRLAAARLAEQVRKAEELARQLAEAARLEEERLKAEAEARRAEEERARVAKAACGGG